MNRAWFAALVVVASSSPWLSSAAMAQTGPDLTVTVSVARGKATRELIKESGELQLRVDLTVGGDKVELRDAVSAPAVVKSEAGTNVQFFNTGLVLGLQARAAAKGTVIFEVDLTDTVGVPRKTGTRGGRGGVRGGFSVKGFELKTQVAVPLMIGKTFELGSVVDPVEGEAWTARLKIKQIRGDASTPSQEPRNDLFTATIVERRPRPAKVVARLLLAPGSRGSVLYRVAHPFSVVSAAGANVQFVECPVGLQLAAAKATDSWDFDLELCREQRAKGGGPPLAHRRGVRRTVELPLGTTLPIGSMIEKVDEGERLLYEATLQRK